MCRVGLMINAKLKIKMSLNFRFDNCVFSFIIFFQQICSCKLKINRCNWPSRNKKSVGQSFYLCVGINFNLCICVLGSVLHDNYLNDLNILKLLLIIYTCIIACVPLYVFIFVNCILQVFVSYQFGIDC